MGETVEPAAETRADEAGVGPFPERLAKRVRALAQTGFAVLDGGLFDDFPRLLRRESLFARSLFLDHADVEVERAGPWLIPLMQSADTPEKVFDLVGDRPAVMFWSCDGGEMALHRHLRTLNLARIPAWTAAGESGPRVDGSCEGHETVMFRHWDPRVLGALLPVLDASQFARIVGPAQEVSFFAADFGGLKRVLRDASWPTASHGMLTLRSEHAVALIGRQMEASRRSICSYLREVAPRRTAALDELQLENFVKDSEVIGRELGVRTERGYGLFAYLNLITNGRAISHPEVRDFISKGDRTPDRQVRTALLHTAEWLEGRTGGLR